MIAVPAFQALPESIVRAANAPMAPRQPAPQAFQNALQMANRRFQVTYKFQEIAIWKTLLGLVYVTNQNQHFQHFLFNLLSVGKKETI